MHDPAMPLHDSPRACDLERSFVVKSVLGQAKRNVGLAGIRATGPNPLLVDKPLCPLPTHGANL